MFTRARWRHLALNGKDLVWNGDHLAIEPCFEAYTPEGGESASTGAYYLVYPDRVSITGSSKERKGTIQDFEWYGVEWYDFTSVFSNIKNVVYSKPVDQFIPGSEGTKLYFSVSFTYEETVTSIRRRDGEKTVSKVEKSGVVEYESNVFNPYDEESLIWSLKRRLPESSSFGLSQLPETRYIDNGGESGESKELYRAVDDDDNY